MTYNKKQKQSAEEIIQEIVAEAKETLSKLK